MYRDRELALVALRRLWILDRTERSAERPDDGRIEAIRDV